MGLSSLQRYGSISKVLHSKLAGKENTEVFYVVKPPVGGHW